MKEVIEQYGKLLIAVIAGTMLIVIVFTVKDDKGNIGFLQMIGFNSNVETADYQNRIDTEASVESSNRLSPTFSTKNLEQLRAGIEVDLSQHIVATDQDGNSINVTMNRIMSTDGVDLTDTCVDGKITFPQSGTYQVEVYAIDGYNATKTQVIKLSVNRGRS